MFYGWRVVAGVFVAQLFVVGFFTYSASLLVIPVREEFGVTLEQVMYSFTIGTMVGLFLMPLAGVALDRYPARWLMSAGTLLFAAGLFGLAQTTTNTQFVVLFGLTMSITNALASSMSASTVISRWFTASRGKALGVSALGTSVGGILLPKLLAVGIAEFGWRETLEYMAVSSILVMLPAVAFLVRGQPAEVNMQPEPAPEGAPPPPDDQTLTVAQVLAMPAFWFMSLSLGLLFCSYGSILANFGPYAVDAGHGESGAATMIITVAIAGLFGKLVFGALADKVNLKLALAAAQLMVAVGFIWLAASPSYIAVLSAATLVGLAAGGMLPVWGALTAQVFGLLSYGRAMGMMGPIITLCVMPAYAIVGRLYDTSGNYTSALHLFAGVLFVAMLLLIPLNTRAANTSAAH